MDTLLAIGFFTNFVVILFLLFIDSYQKNSRTTMSYRIRSFRVALTTLTIISALLFIVLAIIILY